MKSHHFIGAIMLIILNTACYSTYYQVNTRIHKNGTASRDVYTWGDSAFMAGDKGHNPFLFPLDGWKQEKLDSAYTLDFWGEKSKRQNVKVTKQVSSIDQFSADINPGNPLATPRESLQKKFRWFYTYYIYTGTFAEIADKGPVDLNQYLTRQEQALWFQGDMTSYPDLNGIEMKDVLDDIEKKFWNWYGKSMFEVSYSVIQTKEKALAENLFSSRLSVVKDSLYTLHKTEDDFSPEKLCIYLDNYYHTDYFGKFYQKEKESIEALFDEKCRTAHLFEYMIKYKMNMPGDLLSTNSSYQEEEAVVWRVNACRLMAGDYTLTAESRVCNTWAFVVTLLLAIAAMVGFWKFYRK